MREGLIPTALGTVVTGAALASRMSDMKKKGFKNEDMSSMVATGLLGFGLAHVVLGSIDLIQDR
ncbi:asparagine synthase [Irregularibacter muris]|uniref:Asparagine synthase n=1 Tax=Irregularibacter muris TaxID=1796619 RepID=A0AAE3L4C5_9FIRM|nr:asparagine synthase [Irregularibacter muris]MCR1899868.1 asparagine synthase [Irregularibacter muris]NNA37691.1 asparagine synthase [Pseudomonas lundensis]